MAKLLLMTDDEVRSSYRQAADKAQQIGILAELNGVTKADIEQILFGASTTAPLPPPEPRKYKRHDEATQEKIARDHLEAGLSVKAISEKYDVSVPSVKKYIEKYRNKLTADQIPDQTEVETATPIEKPEKRSDDPVKMGNKTMGLLFDAINALLERAENDCAGYDEIIITKSSQRISFVMEKSGVSVNISKDIRATEEGVDNG